FRLTAGQLRWHFSNFEPTERNNIRVAWVGAIADPTRLCPQCTTRALTEADLRDKPARTLTLMRNEIYAVHGRIFQRKDLQEYFQRQTWYRPNPTFQEGWLSGIERRNGEFILAYQIKHGMPR
ncbi:MAG: YARHG domain-containing protein, partial [bacterium]